MAFDNLEKEKQNKIISAACEVFAKHGYKKASMKDIAEAAGISKSVLFKYFSNKENLYIKIFRLASDSIREADGIARSEKGSDTDMFSFMRRSARLRLSLFKVYPWIYRFSYTAAFDTDPFVRELVKKEYENYEKSQINIQINMKNSETDYSDLLNEIGNFKGLREDISPAAAKQIIFWVSLGYLEEKLYKAETDPDNLEQGFEKWIDILELLLKDRSKSYDQKEGRTGVKNE
ncbi:TetR/AcrR family transcriptional regulator [Ruminiclostridium cellobioparum]|uniref:Transcriptional regulator n=1 Tax=Ruminiclostridium cellobioparum subsp. termitidis CT1112 TaxID=1195236 RepID=S0FRM9_RUMCE|nr:TetR/AcrR family transcriptional regulator [Ruminiclostridium cellobioparum]EMS73006.1 Transcriptional regulator [Ruminiclostridium cellobioparum subsp. termitidis CT1112]